MKLENGDIVTDQNTVLNKWNHDFSSLCNSTNITGPVDLNTFRLDESDDFQESEEMNTPVSFNECKRVISLAKSRKAVGIDCLTNEVFKTDSSVLLLCVLFQDCFSSHCVPSLWSKSIIKRIPKTLKTTLGYLQIIGG